MLPIEDDNIRKRKIREKHARHRLHNICKKPYLGRTRMKFKTRLCLFWKRTNKCDCGDYCFYAHGMDELICADFQKRLGCRRTNCYKIHFDLKNGLKPACEKFKYNGKKLMQFIKSKKEDHEGY